MEDNPETLQKSVGSESETTKLSEDQNPVKEEVSIAQTEVPGLESKPTEESVRVDSFEIAGTQDIELTSEAILLKDVIDKSILKLKKENKFEEVESVKPSTKGKRKIKKPASSTNTKPLTQQPKIHSAISSSGKSSSTYSTINTQINSKYSLPTVSSKSKQVARTSGVRSVSSRTKKVKRAKSTPAVSKRSGTKFRHQASRTVETLKDSSKQHSTPKLRIKIWRRSASATKANVIDQRSSVSKSYSERRLAGLTIPAIKKFKADSVPQSSKVVAASSSAEACPGSVPETSITAKEKKLAVLSSLKCRVSFATSIPSQLVRHRALSQCKRKISPTQRSASSHM